MEIKLNAFQRFSKVTLWMTAVEIGVIHTAEKIGSRDGKKHSISNASVIRHCTTGFKIF